MVIVSTLPEYLFGEQDNGPETIPTIPIKIIVISTNFFNELKLVFIDVISWDDTHRRETPDYKRLQEYGGINGNSRGQHPQPL